MKLPAAHDLDDAAASEAVPVVPETAPPSDADVMHKAIWTAWRAAVGPDTPTLNQLIAAGIVRVEVDAVAGYVAVVTADETHRAIGVRRELVVPMAAAFTARAPGEIDALLARGPARIEPLRAAPAARPRG